MKKICLQTKLQDCHMHQRYIKTITMGSKETISDLVYSQKYELRKIRGIGAKCIQAWEDFLKVYGLHIGMTEYEIYQYEAEETSNCSTEETSNCRTESPVDWEQRRYEIAKTMLPIIYANNKLNEDEKCFTLQEYVDGAVNIADTLIKELKKSQDAQRKQC